MGQFSTQSALQPGRDRAGKLLERYGFHIGDQVVIKASDGRIKITKVKEVNQDYEYSGEVASRIGSQPSGCAENRHGDGPPDQSSPYR